MLPPTMGLSVAEPQAWICMCSSQTRFSSRVPASGTAGGRLEVFHWAQLEAEFRVVRDTPLRCS